MISMTAECRKTNSREDPHRRTRARGRNGGPRESFFAELLSIRLGKDSQSVMDAQNLCAFNGRVGVNGLYLTKILPAMLSTVQEGERKRFRPTYNVTFSRRAAVRERKEEGEGTATSGVKSTFTRIGNYESILCAKY